MGSWVKAQTSSRHYHTVLSPDQSLRRRPRLEPICGWLGALGIAHGDEKGKIVDDEVALGLAGKGHVEHDMVCVRGRYVSVFNGVLAFWMRRKNEGCS